MKTPSAPTTLTPNLPATYPQMTLGQSVKDGVGLGIGSAIGHRIIGSFFPSNSSVAPSQAPPPQTSAPCADERRAFEICLLNESQYFCHREQETLSSCLKIHAKSGETK